MESLQSAVPQQSVECAQISGRIAGIDTARGVALLGIFFVNAQLFGQPFAQILDPTAPAGEGWLSVVIYWFMQLFCTGKFYPLFSILFGVGLAMMYQSSTGRGERFGWIYFRRLMLLAVFGVLHIILLWSGDILLIYASIGLWMIWLGRLSPKVLLTIAAVVFSLGLIFSGGFVLLSEAGQSTREITSKPMPEAATTLEVYGKILSDWNPTEMYDSRLIEIEKQVMAQGPLGTAVAIRAFNYLFSSVFLVLVLFWVILPCFCIGAALFKTGFFTGQQLQWRQRFIFGGLLAGLPLSVLSVVFMQYQGDLLSQLIATLGGHIGGPLMSLMYLSLILNWVDSGKLSWLASKIAKAGKMSLTCYLLESLLMSAVMLHWGLAKFGNNTWAERAGWLLGIYLVIVVFANIWMSRFRTGPIEWIWRAFTYWRLPSANH
jgi:uncharacterized protein